MNVPNTMMKSHERPTSWNLDELRADRQPRLRSRPCSRCVPNGKYKTLADVAADAKKRPGEVPISSAGAGSNTHLDLIAFEEAAEIKLLHVPYEGGGQSRTALLGGHVEMVASALGDVQRFIEQGQIKALAIGSKARFPLAPNIPTFIEQGLQGRGRVVARTHRAEGNAAGVHRSPRAGDREGAQGPRAHQEGERDRAAARLHEPRRVRRVPAGVGQGARGAVEAQPVGAVINDRRTV